MIEGVKKVNEHIMYPGRTLIITDNTVSATNVPDGTVLVDTSTGGLKAKLSGATTWSQVLPQNMFAQKSIVTSLYADRSITGTKLALNSIDRTTLMDGEVTSSKLAAKSVSANSLGDDVLALLPKADPTTSMIIFNNGLKVTGDITATGNMIAGKTFTELASDLAEGFIPIEHSEPGDIMAVDSNGDVYRASNKDRAVMGIHSDCYATCFGATPKEIKDKTKVPVGIIGRVPVKVIGPAKKGDLIVAFKDGVGIVDNDAPRGTVIATVIVDKKTYDEERVLCMIGRM